MTGVLIRIVLRYAAGALVIRGYLSPDDAGALTSDPEVAQALEMGVGIALGGVAEGWYFLARRFGWAK